MVYYYYSLTWLQVQYNTKCRHASSDFCRYHLLFFKPLYDSATHVSCEPPLVPVSRASLVSKPSEGRIPTNSKRNSQLNGSQRTVGRLKRTTLRLQDHQEQGIANRRNPSQRPQDATARLLAPASIQNSHGSFRTALLKHVKRALPGLSQIGKKREARVCWLAMC